MDSAARLHLAEWGHVFCLKLLLTDLVLLKDDALKGVLCRHLSSDAQIQAWPRKASLSFPAEGGLLRGHQCM